MDQYNAPQEYLRRVRLPALIIGVVALLVSLIGAIFNTDRFFQSYLFAVIFWLNVSLGCLGILMTQYMIHGKWGLSVRRILEAGAMVIPLMFVLFLPLLLHLPGLYKWIATSPKPAPLMAPKSAYLNVPFFLIRALIYFACWITLAYLLNRWSGEQDRTGDEALTRRMSVLSRPGMIIFFLTITFAAFDWVMSLEPDWYSSIFGVLFLSTEGLSGMALTILAAAYLARREPFSEIMTPARFNDLGNMLLVFIMFWAYINLSQFLIIWSGNIPEEVTWYVHRSENGWQWPIRLILALQFAGPFLVLLSRRAKRNVRAMTILAAVILVMHVIEIYWRVVPAFHVEAFSLSWLDIVLPIGIGGLWVAAFVWLLGRKALVPLHDPRTPQLEEAAAHG
jgi:hypothetical protein